MIVFLLKTLAIILLLLLIFSLILRVLLSFHRPSDKTIGFFHPYCNDGGGGERVLWKMVDSLRKHYPDYKIVIYSGDIEASCSDILQKVKQRFAIEIEEEAISICYLTTRKWVEASRYPVFTMLGQSFGSIILVMEGITQINPHVFIDSMGYSFTLWIARLFAGCTIGAYVHYPTISTDMLSRVQHGNQTYNNRGIISTIPILKQGKLYYYQLFAILYGLAGRAAHLVFVNSKWTKNHIDVLWKNPATTKVLYPPCNCSELSTIQFSPREQGTIISIGQFRPEKDHAKQLQAIEKLLKNYSHIPQVNQVKLVMIGSCRNSEDEQRIATLKQLVTELGIDNHVQFEINVSFSELKNWYSKAQFGIHTMWCEHFGIGIVELMASGVIVIAHNSGGPKSDIVTSFNNQITGKLATTPDQYAQSIAELIQLPPEELIKIQEAARERVKEFSDDNFTKQFIAGIGPLL